MEERLGRSELGRGLAWGDTPGFAEEGSSFWAADLAANALARRSWSRSLPRLVEDVLEGGPGKNRETWSEGVFVARTRRKRGRDLPGLGFLLGSAGVTAVKAAVVDADDLAFSLAAASSFSVRMLSRRASTPATACERRDPHPERLPGAAMASTYAGKSGALWVLVRRPSKQVRGSRCTHLGRQRQLFGLTSGVSFSRALEGPKVTFDVRRGPASGREGWEMQTCNGFIFFWGNKLG